jgi:uncharacterized protein (TIGR02466 family)
MQFFDLFPTRVGIDFLELSQEEEQLLYQCLDNIDLQHFYSETNSDICGMKDFQFLEDEKLLSIKHKINEKFRRYISENMYSSYNFEMTTSWIKTILPGETGHLHNHKNCMYSGVMYNKSNTKEDGGFLVLENLYDSSFRLTTDDKLDLDKAFSILPQKNMVVFFPSNTYHYVSKNMSNDIRTSVAFNFTPSGKYGLNDSTVNSKICKFEDNQCS